MLVSTGWEEFHPISCQMVVRNQLPILPGAFSSWKNYSQLDKEGLGIIFGVKKIPPVPAWTDFLDRYGSKATRQSFQPNRLILNSLPSRIIRWFLLMSSYDYSIMYKPGTNIVAADTVSHLPLQENLHHSPNGPHGWHYSGFCQYSQTYLKGSSPFKALPSCTLRKKSTRGAPLLSVSYKERQTECQK